MHKAVMIEALCMNFIANITILVKGIRYLKITDQSGGKKNSADRIWRYRASGRTGYGVMLNCFSMLFVEILADS